MYGGREQETQQELANWFHRFALWSEKDEFEHRPRDKKFLYPIFLNYAFSSLLSFLPFVRSRDCMWPRAFKFVQFSSSEARFKNSYGCLMKGNRQHQVLGLFVLLSCLGKSLRHAQARMKYFVKNKNCHILRCVRHMQSSYFNKSFALQFDIFVIWFI